MSEKKEEIFSTIRNRIYSGYYWPREQLVESELADEMNVSRTLVRDVLKELAVKGLVTIREHKGTFVSEMSYKQMIDTLELEAILESSAAYLATPRLASGQIEELCRLLEKSKKLDPQEIQAWENYNWDFHRTIIASCGNKKLINTIRDNVQFVKYWFVKLSIPREIIQRTAGHEEILNAIEKRDALKVRELMEKHLLFAAEDLFERLQRSAPNLIKPDDNKSGLMRIK